MGYDILAYSSQNKVQNFLSLVVLDAQLAGYLCKRGWPEVGSVNEKVHIHEKGNFSIKDFASFI